MKTKIMIILLVTIISLTVPTAKAQVTHTLTIESPDGSGGTNPSSAVYTYNEGTIVKINAYPSPYWILNWWVLDGNIIAAGNPAEVIMNQDHTIKAVYVHTAILKLLPPIGEGTYQAFNYAAPYTLTTQYGFLVPLTATPNQGYRVKDWIIDGQPLNQHPAPTQHSILMDQDKDRTVQVIFESINGETITEIPWWILLLIAAAIFYTKGKK